MKTADYRPDIDGLRAVAVLSVVLHHLSASLVPGGYVGVDVFFVISGYLITGIIGREMAEDRFSFVRFYERRTRRIFPALFAMLAVTLVASHLILLPSDLIATLRGALGTLFFSSNMVFWQDLARGYFAATDASLNPLLHTWSLSVEEQFYLFFPVLLMLCFRYVRKFTVPILLAFMLLSLASAAALVSYKSVAVFFLSPFRAWELMVGSLLALNAIPLLRYRALRELIALGGFIAIVGSLVIYDNQTAFPGLTALAPVLGTAAIIHAGSSGDSFVARLLTLRPLTYLGLISYSLYLWHWPLIVLARYAFAMAPMTHKLHWLFLGSLLMASLSYHFIEQPFRRNVRINRPRLFAAAAACTLAMTGWFAIGLLEQGFPSRYSKDVLLLDAARTPQIPFKECSDRPAARACTLGQPNSTPNLLVWGDSHALAWAPAFDQVLGKRGGGAVLATHSSCPPMLGVKNNARPACQSQNLNVVAYLNGHPEIKTVVLSAYWSTYFRDGGPLTLQSGNASVDGMQAASTALDNTIQQLLRAGLKIVLIGPVPVYEKSVPLVLALEHAKGQRWLATSAMEQQSRHGVFFEVAAKNERAGHTAFRFLDPIQWFCQPNCTQGKAAGSWYRDSHHLSVEGARTMADRLFEGLHTVEAHETPASLDLGRVMQ